VRADLVLYGRLARAGFRRFSTYRLAMLGGLRQRMSFDPERTTAAEVLAAVSARATVHDLSIEEPDIEDVVRGIYQATR